MRPTRTISGFTLLELVLVLVLITIMLAVAAPSLEGFARGRATDEAAAQFVAISHWARSRAISDGVTYHLNIDAQGGRWWVTRDGGGGSFINVDPPYGVVYALPTGVQMKCDIPSVDGNQFIEFNPSGRCAVATVHFTGPGGDDIAVASEDPADVYHVVSQAGGQQ